MRLHSLLVAGLALSAGACKTVTTTSTQISGTPRLEPVPAAVVPAPAPFSPAGKWTVVLTAQGQAIEVVMDLVKLADGTWTGTLSTQAFPTMALTTAKLTGKQLVATFPVPTGDTGTMTLNFDGDLVEGEWSMPGDGSKVTGKRN
jgi:hypothetical protein